MNELTYIYTLQGLDDVVRYVGKTDYPNKRLSVHKCRSEYKNIHLKRWLDKTNDITLEVIDVVPKSNWQFWERWHISVFKGWGFNLINLTNGGDGCDGYKHSDEIRSKMKAKHRRLKGKDNPLFGRKRPEMIERNKRRIGTTLTDAHKELLRTLSTGRIHSNETIKKCSEKKKEQWAKGVYSSEEYRRKQSDAHKHKPNIKKRKAIKCNETGEIFSSVKEASFKIAGSTNGNIVSQLKGRLKTAYGYTFSYI